VIDIPGDGDGIVSPQTFSGSAQDDVGVNKVRVAIKDAQTQLYWNDSSHQWQAAWLWNAATLSNPNATRTDWSYRFDLGSNSGSGKYDVRIWAYDQAQNHTNMVRKVHLLPHSPPMLQINQPGNGADVTLPVEIRGSAQDDNGVRAVRVTIKDMASGLYWSKAEQSWHTAWGWNESTLTRKNQPSTDWNFRFAPGNNRGSGSYQIRAWAYDINNEHDPAGVTHTFTTQGSSTDPTWQLVWSDEFDGTALDTSKWQVHVGFFGKSDQKQIYTARPKNVRVENCSLILEAHRETYRYKGKTRNYTSGMIVSNDTSQPSAGWGRGNVGWTYGRFEIRAKMPNGHGLWPALWMRPQDSFYGSWPRSGEIDILEYLGPQTSTPNGPIDQIQGNLHWGTRTKSQQRQGRIDITPQSAQEYHVHALEWTPTEVRWYLDGKKFHTVSSWDTKNPLTPPAPFDKDFFLTFNLQIGGWAGTPQPRDFPDALEIDWVKVYQSANMPATTPEHPEPGGGSPTMEVEDPEGAPGSQFAILGRNFPADVSVPLLINDLSMIDIVTDGKGDFSVVVVTEPTTEVGIYNVTTSDPQIAATSFTLNDEAMLLPETIDGPQVGLPQLSRVFLPFITK